MHALEAQIARLDLLAERISSIRMVLAIVGIAAIWWSAQSTTSPRYAWLVPLTLFVAAVIYHSRVRRARTRTDRAAAHYRVGLARIEDRWSGLGNPGTELEDAHHVYAADLDLFGQGNLFELLSTARTRMGERTLAAWLLSPAPTSMVLQRQQSIAELRDRLDFREDLAVLGETAEVGVRPEELSRWAESANQLTQPWILPAALLLPVLLIAALILWNVTAMASPVVAILLLELGVVRLLRKRLAEILGSTEQAFDKLRLLADLTARLEHEPLDARSRSNCCSGCLPRAFRHHARSRGSQRPFSSSSRAATPSSSSWNCRCSTACTPHLPQSAGAATTAARSLPGWMRSASSKR